MPVRRSCVSSGKTLKGFTKRRYRGFTSAPRRKKYPCPDTDSKGADFPLHKLAVLQVKPYLSGLMDTR